jgi:hypothetical protein
MYAGAPGSASHAGLRMLLAGRICRRRCSTVDRLMTKINSSGIEADRPVIMHEKWCHRVDVLTKPNRPMWVSRGREHATAGRRSRHRGWVPAPAQRDGLDNGEARV